MSDTHHGYTHDELTTFGHRLSEWAAQLDDTQKAMLIDLLAKAGADVYGNDMANDLATPDDASADASSLSPLEYDDFLHAVQGIFDAQREVHEAMRPGYPAAR